ncbi:2,3-diaminopropionate biosynthesis protein SbnA [Thalassomonas haliotis]|uniref:N-(2-amino-2-carboxyethyl)-L-glutamate synthase n=1 Tax=Thalassomonas haliotis TaxID=485448 RepID=A0ABY7VCC4_9GAMM|nr:2,3-diaminopropionate biosynthesis protein SbnA [Thalassomonas haliotis]WDE11313.1 2,3-diaminopropionate biosynthesis protein SbnA [Thalassomonas haliotis]
MKDNLGSCVGNTPIVRLSKLFKYSKVEVLAKMELLNPGGSIKDRPAKYMLEQGLKSGKINENSHIIESSSGDMALALAMQCKLHGLAFTAVVDPQIPANNLKMLKLYGANVIQVKERDENNHYLLTRIKTVKSLEKAIPNAVWLNQYSNPHNWQSHFYGEGEEIIRQLDGPLDYLVMDANTLGALMGISRRLKQAFPELKIVSVQIQDSLLFREPCGPGEIPGLNEERVPNVLELSEIDRMVEVDDYESALACYNLLDYESIFAGACSGSAIAAIEKMLPELPEGSRILTLLPDHGDRYLDFIYNDSWQQMAKERHLDTLPGNNNGTTD